MNFYLDEDSIDPLLIRFLRRAGHDVAVPGEAGALGESDPVQMTHAIRQQRIFLTRNHQDFFEIHELIRVAAGHHNGILVVRRDNDPNRDMSPRGVVNSIEKYTRSGLNVADQFVVLNQWR